MTPAFELHTTRGLVAACGPTCYNGHIRNPDCPCGGRCFGAGFHQAVQIATKHAAEIVAEYSNSNEGTGACVLIPGKPNHPFSKSRPGRRRNRAKTTSSPRYRQLSFL